jgi:periplasmic divalent cation tolerance protein
LESVQFVVVLTTLPADGDAEQFAARLVEEKLAACVNILPAMRSVYRWQQAVEHAEERQLVIKTAAHCVAPLEELIRKAHPYDVPEFVVIPLIQGSVSYLSWLADSTR